MREAHYKEYEYLINLLKEGGIPMLEEAESIIDSFPTGKDQLVGRNWIINAIDCGSIESVKWVLSRKIDLSFRDDEGSTPLLSAIDRDLPEKYEILQILIDHGAPINKKGFNDWSPLHLAAARNDVDALKVLIKNNADLYIRTEIDDYATPIEEAKSLNCNKAYEYLQSIV